MRWGRLVVLVLWTSAFAGLGFVFFSLSVMGDCHPGPEGAACWAAKRSAPLRVGIGEAIVYAGLTWVIFVRRWRQR